MSKKKAKKANAVEERVKKVVKFCRGYAPYNAGDVAGFNKEMCEKLYKAGYVHYVNPAKVEEEKEEKEEKITDDEKLEQFKSGFRHEE